jgi:hypothetical protein
MKFAPKKIESWHKTCVSTVGIIAIVGTAATLCWAKLAQPEIQKQIDITVAPMKETLEYICFIEMENLNDSQINHANKRYFAARAAKKPTP